MHAITFDLGPMGAAGSNPAMLAAANDVLAHTAAVLRQVEPRSRVERGAGTERVFVLPHVFTPGSDLGQNANALQPLLECLCALNGLWLDFRRDQEIALYRHPVRYDRTVVWDTLPALFARGYGDCKSLTAARVAEYRRAGAASRPFFRFLPPEMNPAGQFMYHILVLGPFGWEDPSKIKGMGQDEWAHFQSSIQEAA